MPRGGPDVCAVDHRHRLALVPAEECVAGNAADRCGPAGIADPDGPRDSPGGAPRIRSTRRADSTSWKPSTCATDKKIGGRAEWRRTACAERVHKIQTVTSLYALTQLQPENADAHRRYADMLMREKFIDLALEHQQAAEKAMEAYKPINAEDQKRVEGQLQQQRKYVQALDKMVKQRLAKWKEMCASLKPGNLSSQEIALKKATLAYVGEFEEMQGNQRVPAPLGRQDRPGPHL